MSTPMILFLLAAVIICMIIIWFWKLDEITSKQEPKPATIHKQTNIPGLHIGWINWKSKPSIKISDEARKLSIQATTDFYNDLLICGAIDQDVVNKLGYVGLSSEEMQELALRKGMAVSYVIHDKSNGLINPQFFRDALKINE